MGENRDLSSLTEDTRGMDIGPDNDTKSTNGLDTMIAFRKSDVDGYLCDLLPNSQENLDILTREINSLWQWVEAGEGQLAEGLDHIDWLEGELHRISHKHSGNNWLQPQHLQNQLEM